MIGAWLIKKETVEINILSIHIEQKPPVEAVAPSLVSLARPLLDSRVVYSLLPSPHGERRCPCHASDTHTPPFSQAQVGTFPTDLCGCCAVKDCGCGCCLKLWCCFNCNYGSAMEAADLGACCLCCCCFGMFSPCVGCYNRGRLVEKYNIDEPQWMSCLVYFFCTFCAAVQDMNLVCEKENKCVPSSSPFFFFGSAWPDIRKRSQDVGLLRPRSKQCWSTACSRCSAHALCLGRTQTLKTPRARHPLLQEFAYMCARLLRSKLISGHADYCSLIYPYRFAVFPPPAKVCNSLTAGQAYCLDRKRCERTIRQSALG